MPALPAAGRARCRLSGEFCRAAAVAGAPQRCQPRGNPMPESPGFTQGLNLNLGEKQERKVSLRAGA